MSERFAFRQRARGLNTHWSPDAEASDNKREERTTESENKFSNSVATHPRARYTQKGDIQMKTINKVIFLALFLSTAQANVVCDTPRDQAKSDLKQNLLNRYGSSYSTVNMLLKAGMRDYDTICKVPNNSISNGILKNLNSRYYPSFSTILMLYKSNIKSFLFRSSSLFVFIIVFLLLFLSLESGNGSSVTGSLNMENIIEVGIARSILYPIIFSSYYNLNDFISIIMGTVLFGFIFYAYKNSYRNKELKKVFDFALVSFSIF